MSSRLAVDLLKGANLLMVDDGKSDPYVVFTIQPTNESKTSSCIKKTLNPMWNQRFEFLVPNDPNATLDVSVFDKGFISDNQMGFARIPLRDAEPYYDGYSVLLGARPGYPKDRYAGAIFLKVSWVGPAPDFFGGGGAAVPTGGGGKKTGMKSANKRGRGGRGGAVARGGKKGMKRGAPRGGRGGRGGAVARGGRGGRGGAKRGAKGRGGRGGRRVLGAAAPGDEEEGECCDEECGEEDENEDCCEDGEEEDCCEDGEEEDCCEEEEDCGEEEEDCGEEDCGEEECE